MFSNLGLFSRIPCPDIARCTRRSCLFSHDPSLISEVVEGDVKAVAGPSSRQPAVNRKGASRPTASIAISHPTVFTKKPTPTPSSSSTSANPSTAVPRQLSIKAPVLNINSRLSRQSILDRRKGLERLYDEYRALYATVLRTDPSCAADHALIEESSISNGTTVASYGSAIRSACMQLRARGEMPKDTSSRFYGTIAEVKVKMKRWEEDQRSRLTKENVRGYLMTPEQMEVFGYVYSTPEGEGSNHTTCLGERKMCDRCGVDFTVRGPTEQAAAPHPPCVYHWGKATMERIDGHRMARWSCCGSDRTLNEQGCAIAEFHVFKDGKSWKFSDRRQMATDEEGQKREKKEEIEVLHSREAFKSTKRVLRELREASGTTGAGTKRKRDGVHDIVAMDCEMICECQATVSGSPKRFRIFMDPLRPFSRADRHVERHVFGSSECPERSRRVDSRRVCKAERNHSVRFAIPGGLPPYAGMLNKVTLL